MTTTARQVSVFDAPLPTIDYHGVQRPDEAHDIIARARRASQRSRWAPSALSC